MAIKLNHTIVHARDKRASASFMTELFALPPATSFGPFLCVELANEVTLDFIETDEHFNTQHYAFLVSETDFDQIFARIEARALAYWADPGRSQPGAINRHDSGRGVYFADPSDNLLEVITRPYGSGS